VLKYLLRKGADVHATDKDGYSALNLAQLSGHVTVVEMLLAEGREEEEEEEEAGEEAVKVEVVGGASSGMGRPIDELFIEATKFALGTGQLQKVVNLLATGANVNASSRDERRWTAMHMAAHKGVKNVTDLLLAHGPINLDARDGKQYTALHFAAVQGHARIVAILVEAGAAIDLINEDGDTPLQLAEHKGHGAIVEYLRQAEEDLAELQAFADEDEDEDEDEDVDRAEL
jgi:ankyrin repeat protein